MTTDERLTAPEETDARIVDLLERVVELIEETRRESQPDTSHLGGLRQASWLA